ncbi:MAG TPA: hypothetical protein PKW55_05055 [Spirochaetota bacterium]|nr:hypothetical protein [Spirochaetota bacterium]HOM37680.1 hypothetical protein [Spirochaetota bacterium]HPQ49638.1 hypothetical protein [Spirochaetota bacterium]
MYKKYIYTIIGIVIGIATHAVTNWVAEVDGKKIMYSEFIKIFDSQLEVMKIMSNNQIDISKFRNNKDYQLKFLEEYITMNLVLERIKKENSTAKFIDEKWLNSTSQAIANYIKDQLILKAYLEKVLLPKIGEVSDKEIEEVYNKYKDNFKDVSAKEASKIIETKIKEQKALILLEKLKDKVKSESKILINEDEFKK